MPSKVRFAAGRRTSDCSSASAVLVPCWNRSISGCNRHWLSYRASRRSRRRSAMRWDAGVRCCATREDGTIEIDNNAAERALRAVALGRKNYLFAGSDSGGERAAAIYSLIGTAKLNGLDPEAYSARGAGAHCRPSDQPHRRTAALEPCCQTPTRLFVASNPDHSYRKCPSIFKWTLTPHTHLTNPHNSRS